MYMGSESTKDAKNPTPERAEIYRPILVESVLQRLEKFAEAEKRSRQNAVNYGLSQFLKGKGY